MPILVEFDGGVSTASTGARIELRVDGTVVFSHTFPGPAGPLFDFEAMMTVSEQVEIVSDPLSSCHNDGFGTTLRVFTTDCNGNLVADAVEIANGSAGDANVDGVPDSCQCFADVIQNGIVDGADLSALLSVWGTAGGLYPRADCNGDGTVNGADLSIVLSGWGACPE